MTARMLVDGELTAAVATFPILNPATGEEIGRAPDATAADVDAAIAAARRAFDETDWSTDRAFRVHCLRQLHCVLVDHGPAMRALTTAEAGAPAFLTTGPQYDIPVEALRWTTDLAESYAWETDLGFAAPLGIVNQSSTAAYVYSGFYGLAKSGVNGLTLQLAHELGGMGIRVNAIAPGPTDTAATRTQVGGMVDELVKGLAIKRMGRTDDMVGACLYLLSDQASWVTGQILAVDGGQTCRP